MSYYARASCPVCGRNEIGVHPTTGRLYSHYSPAGGYCPGVVAGPVEPERDWRCRDPRIRPEKRLSRLERLRWHYLQKG